MVLTVNLAEHVCDLFLCKSLGVESPRKTVTFLFLIAQNGQNLWMEVAVTVARDAKLQFLTLPVGVTRSITVAFVVGIISQKITALCYHHALKHNSHKVMKTIFFLRMLA